MLSRIAEALFWIGRYVERADDTARILDVHYHLLLEDPWIDEEAACRALLEVMGAGDGVASPTGRTVNEILAYDEASPSSIAGAVKNARENARGVREAISSEMWECLNATWLALREGRVLAGASPSLFFRFVKERAAFFVGLTEMTMSRDEAWRFLAIGRALERIDMTCRLLSARWSDAAGSAGWVTTLRCCSAHESYLRTYRRAVDVSLAGQFLLLDRSFPRSVYYTLEQAERRLAELTPTGSAPGPHDDARRQIGRARTDLEFRPVDELLDEFPSVLSEVQAAGSAASAAVAARFFGTTSPLVWTA